MSLATSLLPEYDHEMATTRRCLESFPDDKADWKPHEKSMSMAGLSSHIVEIPTYLTIAMGGDSWDMHPPGGEPYRSPHYASKDALLEAFDRGVPAGREALASATDEDLMGQWSMLSAGNTLMTMPRLAVVRSFVLNHLVHHRAQLGVYYRLLDIPVPAVYGPSADES